MFSCHFYKRKHYFVFSCLLSFPKWDLSLILLHSERPKLHRILAVLSAIGLKERKCCPITEFLSLSVDSVEKGCVDGRLAILRHLRVFQSYQDDGLVIMEGLVQCNPASRLKRVPPPAGLKPRIARSAGQRLAYFANG